MENETSEQELKQLLDEGKINEDEYQQLLSSMNKPTFENPPISTYQKPKAPISLKIVAWLFIINGIISCIEMAWRLMQGRIYFSVTVIGIFIGWGLLIHSRGWRIVALILLMLMIIIIPTFSMFYLNQPSSGFHVHIFGNKLPRDPKLILFLDVLCLLPILWSYWVLTRPQIKSLFGINNN